MLFSWFLLINVLACMEIATESSGRAGIDTTGVIGVDELVSILSHLAFIDLISMLRTSKQVMFIVNSNYPKKKLNLSQYATLMKSVHNEDSERVANVIAGGFWNLGCVLDNALLRHENYIKFPFLLTGEGAKQTDLDLLEFLLDHSFEPIEFRFIVDHRNSTVTADGLPLVNVGSLAAIRNRQSEMKYLRQLVIQLGRYALLVKMIEYGYPSHDEAGTVLHEALHLENPVPCLIELMKSRKVRALINKPNDKGELAIDLFKFVDVGLMIACLRAGATVKNPSIIANTILLCPDDTLTELIQAIIHTMDSSRIQPGFSDKHGFTLLHYLVQRTSNRELIKAMIGVGFDPHQKDLFGRTAMCIYSKLYRKLVSI